MSLKALPEVLLVVNSQVEPFCMIRTFLFLEVENYYFVGLQRQKTGRQ
jgi:hypothetical protein